MRDKQIEEMAKVIARRNKDFRNPNIAFMITAKKTAEALYNAGYRKASDIFEEIENNYADFLYDGHRNIIVLTEKDFNELKKKYESEGEG